MKKIQYTQMENEKRYQIRPSFQWKRGRFFPNFLIEDRRNFEKEIHRLLLFVYKVPILNYRDSFYISFRFHMDKAHFVLLRLAYEQVVFSPCRLHLASD